MRRISWGMAVLLVAGVGLAALAGLVGCQAPADPPAESPAAAVRLVAFDSCDAALEGFQEAARAESRRTHREGPAIAAEGGTAGDEGAAPAEGSAARPQEAPAVEGRAEAEAAPLPPQGQGPDAPASDGAGKASDADGPAHSTTNNHEAGVEEPDVVQTDGRRVVTVADGTLRVVDAASKKVTSTIELPGGWAEELLLDGDRVLAVGDDEVTLIDLAGAGRIVGTLEVDGNYVDARMINGRARLVLRSEPRVPTGSEYLPGEPKTPEVMPEDMPEDAPAAPAAGPEPTAAEESIVDDTTIDDWLPSYELTTETSTESGRLVACDAVSHPETYRATSMLTLLTVNLHGQLTTGDPVTVAADGSTVYGTAESLYVAHDQDGRTALHQFAIGGPGKPRYVASGSVDGTLLNQYSMSEHDGHLRVATITGGDNTVTVLARKGNALSEVGRLGGLGKGERIYAVRFFGPVGYVVTFRETDPLYTLDLRDPAAPRAVGELKITGYSAYLHAAGEGRLLGVGQEADLQGRALGIQVSLFDVSEAANPRRIAQHRTVGGMAQVEQDTHAFLYWQPTGLLVLPTSGDALVLRLADGRFENLGTIGGGQPVLRTLIIGDELWALSTAGFVVHDATTLARLAAVPFAAS